MNTNRPQTAVAAHDTTTSSVAGRALSVAMAALLGAFLIFGVGFSHVSAFHNAAHDVRHSNAFPCH